MKHALRPRLLPLLIAGLCLPAPALSQLDALELRLSRQFETPLRWLDVGADDLVGGPGADAADGRLELAPGQSLMLRLPAGEALRVHRAGQPLALDALRFSVSDGSGLFVEQAPRRGIDGHDLLLDTDGDGAHLVRLTRPLDARDTLHAGLYIGRHQPLADIAPYRDELALPGETLELRSGRFGDALPAWRVAPDEALAVSLSGPARLMLVGRIEYSPERTDTRQPWRLTVSADGREIANWSLDTAAEQRRPLFLDDAPLVASREHRFTFTLSEAADELRIDSDQPALLRLLRQDPDDYLLPAFNAPRPNAAEVLEDGLALRMTRLWSRPLAEVDRILDDPHADPADVVRAAQRLARDNRRREGGLRGAVAIERLAEQRRDAPQLRREAASAFGQHSFYRDLLPERFAPGTAPRLAWMLRPRPALRPRTAGGRAVSAGQQGELIGAMASARFVPLAAGHTLEYPLEERFSPSWLELAAHAPTGQPARLWLQFDDEPPRAISLDAGLPAAQDFRSTVGEAALALLRHRHGPGAGTTLDAAFARHGEPAPLIRAGIARIALPQAVQRVRIWGDDDGARPWVALRVRASRPFRWTEQAWRQAARALGMAPLQASLGKAFSARGAASEAPLLREMDSHWQALVRAVRSAAGRFEAPVVAPVGKPAPATADQLRAARAAADRGDWVGTLQALAGRVGADALSLRVPALERLGEDWLAELQLRQALLHGDPRSADLALSALDARYRRARDHGALRGLHASAWLGNASAARTALLARALLDDGEPALALSLALTLPEPDRPLAVVLEASLRAQWWQSFDEALASLDGHRQELWRGHGAIARGDEAAATAAWQQTGDEGARWLAQLRTARALSERLTAPGADRAALQAEVAQWLAWHPGPQRWRSDERLFAAAAGAAALYSIDRDLHFRAMRATADQPAVLRVAGPARLRITARPLHPGSDGGPLDGWLQLRSGGRSWREPILANWPGAGLRVSGDAQARVGRAVRREITLGPGWHEVEVDGGALTLVLNAEIERPALALPLLVAPSWSTAGLTATPPALAERPAWAGDCAGCLWITDRDADGKPRTSALQLDRGLLHDNRQRLDDEAFARLQAERPGLLPTPADSPRERLLALLWRAEQRSREDPGLLAEAEALVLRHPEMDGVAAVMRRLREGSAWQRFDNIAASAGLRAVETGPLAESPALRAREALLAPLQPGQRRLSGEGRLVFFLDRPRAGSTRITLQGETVPGLPSPPLQAYVQLDGGHVRPFELPPGSRRTIALRVPAGRHALRVWMARPAPGQSLRIDLKGAAAHALEAADERLFHVALADEPLRASVPGPAWLRVDEWRDGALRSRYRHVAGDWEEIELRPTAGQRQALFRLHTREYVPAERRPPTPPVQARPRPVPAPPVLADAEPSAVVELRDGLPLGGQGKGTWSIGVERVRSLESEDNSGDPVARYDEARASYRLHDDRRGRFLRGELMARRHPAGNPSGGVAADWLQQRGELPFETRFAGSAFVQQPRLVGIDGQRDGGLAWSLSGRAELALPRRIDGKTRHRPRLALFARRQSLSGDQRLDPPSGLVLAPGTELIAPGGVERDVYTRYREQHPYGLSLGDTLRHRPWLDSETWLTASASSNPNFNPLQPDHVSVGAGWRQLAGALLGEVSLRGTHYFEDNHRDRASDTGELTMELRWEHWTSHLYRHELGLRYQQRLDDGLWGLGLFWQLHLGNGRGYDDFRASETPFRALRERRLPRAANHFIEAVEP